MWGDTGRYGEVWGDEDELVLEHLRGGRLGEGSRETRRRRERAHPLEDAERVPLAHDLLHVRVRGEEGDHAVGHGGGDVEEQLAVVAHGGGLGAQVKLGRERRLVGAARHDEREDDVAREGHGEGVDGARLEAENLGVHVDGRQGACCYQRVIG